MNPIHLREPGATVPQPREAMPPAEADPTQTPSTPHSGNPPWGSAVTSASLWLHTAWGPSSHKAGLLSFPAPAAEASDWPGPPGSSFLKQDNRG